MALEDILKTLEDEVSRECEEIISRAKSSSKKLLDDAKEEAKITKEQEIAKVCAGLEGERTKVLNAARLSVKKDVIKAKEEVINKVFSEVNNRLQKLRKGSEYSRIFEALAHETIDGVQGKMNIEVDSADIGLAKGILDKMGKDYALQPSPNQITGLKVTTDDNRITITNTFESRLEKAHQFLKPEITKTLFG